MFAWFIVQALANSRLSKEDAAELAVRDRLNRKTFEDTARWRSALRGAIVGAPAMPEDFE